MRENARPDQPSVDAAFAAIVTDMIGTPDTGRYLTQNPLGLQPSPNPNTYPNNPTT